MTFILIIATLFLNIFGVASEAVNNINHILGTHMSGFLMFVIAWIVTMILDSIVNN